MADTTVTITGNLTDDPELRYTANGIAVSNFRVAVTPRVRQGDTWTDGETSFFKCNVWRDQAENVAESLSKGMRVLLTGTLKQNQWETPEGDKRSSVEIVVDEIGPALKFQITRAKRASAAQPEEEKPAPTRARRGRQARETKPTSGGGFDDDAPF
jgi:single-strand DNA-binding protein